jgi:hypothetical protein
VVSSPSVKRDEAGGESLSLDSGEEGSCVVE